MAKAYSQEERIDYEETFFPIVRFTVIRLILAIVLHLDLELHQMVLKILFLNGELQEESYMQQSVNFVVEGQEQKVCKQQKIMYDLKYSSRQWHLKFHQAIIVFEFHMIDDVTTRSAN